MNDRPLSALRAKTIACFSIAVLVALALNMLNLGLVYFLREVRHASAGEIGLFTSLFWLSYSAGCHLFQPRFNHLPASTAVRASMLSMAALVVFYIVVPWLPVLMFLALLKGLALSLFWPVVMGWITAGLEGRELNHMMSRFNLAWSCGMIIGPGIAGWLSDLGAVYPLYVGIALYLAGALIVTVIVRLQPEAERERSGGTPQDRNADPVDRSTPLRYPAWVGLFVTFVALGVIINVFPLAGEEELGHTRSQVGNLFLLRAFLSTGLFVILGRVVFWHYRMWPMIVCMIAQVLLYGGLIWAEQLPALTLIFCGMGIASAMVYNTSLFHGAAGSPDRTARMAMHESLIGGGMVIGSIVGGWLYEHHGMQLVYALTAGALVLSTLIQAVQYLVQNRQRPS